MINISVTAKENFQLQEYKSSTVPEWNGAAVISGLSDLRDYQVCGNRPCTAGQGRDGQCSGSSFRISNR